MPNRHRDVRVARGQAGIFSVKFHAGKIIGGEAAQLFRTPWPPWYIIEETLHLPEEPRDPDEHPVPSRHEVQSEHEWQRVD